MSGTSTLEIIQGSTLSYSQNREDLILAGFFDLSKKGFYVDVGANDPDRDTVTRIFYENGWSGINIEPIESHYQQLLRRRRRDINLNVGISEKEQVLNLREYEGSGLSTFSKKMQEQYQAAPNIFTEKYRDYSVKTKTLAQVFKEQKVKEISFLKVDVEGFEYDVLSSNDWQIYRPMVLCIEANHIEKDWRPILSSNNYELVFSDGLNEYYQDKTCKEKLKQFSYISAIIDRKPIVDYLILDKLNLWVDRVNGEVVNYENKIVVLENRIHDYDKQLQALWHKYNQVATVSRHLKTLVIKVFRRLDRLMIRMLSARNKFRPVEVESYNKKPAEALESVKRVDTETFQNYISAGNTPFTLGLYTKIRNQAFRVSRRILRYFR